MPPIPVRGPVLAVDVGTKRIGLAVCDPSRTFVFTRGVIARADAAALAAAKAADRTPPDLAAVRDLAKEERALLLAVGLPLNVDGTEGEAAKAARGFGAELGVVAGLPVVYVDERYTSMEADEALRMRMKNPKERKAKVDAAAAALILRTYLEHGAV